MSESDFSLEESWDDSGTKSFSSLGDSYQHSRSENLSDEAVKKLTSVLRSDEFVDKDSKSSTFGTGFLKKNIYSFHGQLEMVTVPDIDPSRSLPGVLKTTYDNSPRLLIIDPGDEEANSDPNTKHAEYKSSSDSTRGISPRKMHVHFSNTLEIVHDIPDSPPECSDRDSEDKTSDGSKPNILDYSSDFEQTDSSTGKPLTETYSSNFISMTTSQLTPKKYSSDFEQTFSEGSESFDQRTSQFSDDSDTQRNISDSGSYTDSQYSGISSLADDTSDDNYSDTFESTPFTTETSGCKLSHQSSSNNYDEETFEGNTTDDTSSIKHSILDSLVFPDLIDIETTDARNQFIADTIYKLRHHHVKFDLDLPEVTPFDTKGSKRSRQLSSYCEMKIQQLKSHKKGLEKEEIKPKLKFVPVETYGIGSNQVERLKLQNLMTRLKTKCEEDIHDVKTCEFCSVKLDEINGSLLEKEFIRKSHQKIESKIMDDKIQKHLIKMNSVNLIAEIIREIPKLSDDSRETLYTYQQKVAARITPS